MSHIPRLDVLLYAHDGRGLGHAGRSIGIGMALRRRYPGLRVLFLSGCAMGGELIGGAPLDWLKLPSYATRVIDGTSRGVDGNSGFSDRDLGLLRAEQIKDIVRLYRPRLVLADHTPQGKHRELVPAIEATAGGDTVWLLGVRGVVGGVAQAASELAGRLFRDHYSGLLWYGDSLVLGDGARLALQERYGLEARECGYVSRLKEYCHWQSVDPSGHNLFAGTLALPWLGEKSLGFARELAAALALIGGECGQWRLFVDREGQGLFADLPHCRLEAPSGPSYAEALLHSRSALVYGGYNSLVDVLCTGLPSVVVMREMQDDEQRQHLARLCHCQGDQLEVVVESEATACQLARLLQANLQKDRRSSSPVNTSGAARAAELITTYL